MSNKQDLEKYSKSKPFARYMKSSGVKEYLYFAHVPAIDYVPSLADAAMSLYESIGKYKCADKGIIIDAGGNVSIDGENIGISQLAHGKSNKGITITMWLEDVGQLGFIIDTLKREMDNSLWPSWFDTNVSNKITTDLLRANYRRGEAEYSQQCITRHPWWKTMIIRLKELPSNIRVGVHLNRTQKIFRQNLQKEKQEKNK
jgi:hypothetical protein